MSLINSRLGLFTAAGLATSTPSPKVRGHFAEFLNEVHSLTLGFSPDYLCRFAVRAVKYSLEAFLGSVTSATSLL